MPRIGQNPMKWVAGVHQPERITVCTIVFIPSLDGYWEQSLDVLKLCLNSLFENTETPFDLMVFDNGSCEEVQDYLLSLRRQDQIDYLILSTHNIGKVGAWDFLFQAAPGEIVAYADSDVLFLPGWLERSLEVLEAFPEAGMVTAQPARRDLSLDGDALSNIERTVSLKVEKGELLPPEYLEVHRIGLGVQRDEYQRQITGRHDVRISRGDITVYVAASHFQFLTKKAILHLIFPLHVTIPLGPVDDLELDKAVNRLGYWRLSTAEYLVHHIGNRLPTDQEELPCPVPSIIKPMSRVSRQQTHSGFGLRVLGRKAFTRRMMKRLNVLTYRILYEK